MVLKKVTVNDLDLINSWLNKEYVKKFFEEPMVWINEIEENIENSDWIHHFIVINNGFPIGFVQYYETNKAPKGIWSKEPEGTVGIDYLIGEEDYLNKGYGTKIIKNLITMIQRTHNYRFIIADPVLENIASVSVLIKNGFIKQRSGLYRLIIK